MSKYQHTTSTVPCEEHTFCADCNNPIALGGASRRRVVDIGAPVFKVEWVCDGECGPIFDVSDETMLRKRIAELEQLHARALERELTHDEYDCNDLECTRHGWRAKDE